MRGGRTGTSKDKVPDTLDGRFAVLSTLDGAGPRPARIGRRVRRCRVGRADRALHRGDGGRASRARARRSDARQDGAQARRRACAADGAMALGRPKHPMDEATRDSLYKGEVPPAALDHSTARWSGLRAQLDDFSLTEIAEGRLAMNDPFAHHLHLDQIRDGDRVRPCRRRTRAAMPLPIGSDLPRSAALKRMRPCRAPAPLVRVEGRIAATLEQRCVVTGDPLPGISTSLSRYCSSCPNRRTPAPDEEIELGEHDCDVVFYDGARSTSAARSPTRSRSASIPTREAPAPTPRSGKRA